MAAETHTILLVDDNRDVLDSLAQLLEAQGYTTDVAENGQEALEKLHEGRPPCLVVTDLRMPVMSGWELRDEMKKDQELADLPVVVVSANPMTQIDEKRLDAVACLQKPLDFMQLLRVLNKYC